MGDYIEREAVLYEWGELLKKMGSIDDGAYPVDFRAVIDNFKTFPAADVVPVVHGRWEDVYGGKYQNKRYRCTACKEKALFKFYQDELLSWHEEQKLSNYCPNCGAKVGGDS